MMFAYMLKARKNSGINDLFFWCDAKTEARAKLQLQIAMEDAGVEVGRGHDYQLPIRTDVPVFDDLPEEGALDATWCDRYALADDNRTWQKIVAAETKEPETDTVETTSEVKVPSREKVSERLAEMRNLNDEDIIDSSKLPFNTEIAHYWLGGMYTATPNERKAAISAEMDTDNSYLQNVLLAMNSVEPCKHCFCHIRQSLVENIQNIWPLDGKRPELNLVLTFAQEWMTAINDNSDTDGVKRKSVTEKWLTRYRKERTESGVTAGGMNRTDRSPDLEHTLDTLDEEIACALLPMDFNIYNIPGSIHRRGKEMVSGKESPWKEWSRKLRNCPGILDYSRAAIFAVIRSAAPNIHMMPGTLQAWINAKLTESDHANPSAETLALAMPSVVLNSTTETSVDAGSEVVKDEAVTTHAQPEIKRISATVFSIEGLIGSENNDKPDINTPSNEVEKQEIQPAEQTSDEQMETTNGNEIAGGTEISAGQDIDANGEEVAAVEPELTVEEEKQSAQSINQLLLRIERLEKALASLGDFFTAPVEVE